MAAVLLDNVWVTGPLWIEQGSTLHQLARKVNRIFKLSVKPAAVKRHYANFVVVVDMQITPGK